MAAKLSSLDRKRLRGLLGLLFLALALPAAILVRQALLQLKWESFHQHQVLAEELSDRIDARLRRLIDAEEERSFADYAFLVVAGEPAANFVQRSPLSQYPPKSGVPGLVGYFQIDAQGVFSSPLLPGQGEAAVYYGISAQELAQRSAAQARVLEVLSRNHLARAKPKMQDNEARRDARPADAKQAPAAPPAPASANIVSQAPFDALSEEAAPRKPELSKPAPAKSRVAESLPTLGESLAGKFSLRSARKEKSALPVPQAPSPEQKLATPPIRVTTFESEIDPFEFNRLDSGHFVLFRKVWRDGQRYIQGMVVEATPFLRETVGAEFLATALSHISGLQVAYRGGALANFDAAAGGYLDEAGELRGDGLYRTRLSAPLSEMELAYTLANLPTGPGGAVVAWLAGILALVLCGGFALLHRLGLRLINLARQQQDFVSAVSHELKTPLTSIRLYGEMLREGWVPEEKKANYYEFICAESERLSRLIANVLQLARMTRNNLDIAPRPTAAGELLQSVTAKVKSQIERSGFELYIDCPEQTAQAIVMADADAFTQIMINLIDNALKFSAKSPQKRIDLNCQSQAGRGVLFAVRDYGPGVPKDQMKKIFTLFYRLENEPTRETVGTGIGLALVRQLAKAMGAEVELLNRAPGAEFQLRFPASDNN